MTMGDGFTVKEVVVEIKQDLKAFRDKYDIDQDRRDDEMSRRPTRKELYASIGVIGVLVSVVVSIVGA